MKENNKLVYVEFLRLFTTLLVIMVHICNSARLIEDNVPLINKTICIAGYNLFCVSVPIFVMITGLLLLNPEKNITVEKIIKKYILRMVLVLLTFGVGYSWMELIFDQKTINPIQLVYAFGNMLKGETWAHMWYIYMLIGLYALTPLFRALIMRDNDKEIKFFIAVMFLFICIPHMIEGFTGFKLNFYTPITYIYPLYYVLGYYLGNMKYDTGKDKYIYTLGIISMFILIGSAFIQSYCGIESFENVALFSSPFILFFGMFIFISFRDKRQALEKYYSKLIVSQSRHSFGIYILHMFFVNIIYKLFKINPLNYPIIISLPLMLIIVYTGSFIGTWILLKIPFLRKYIL